MNKRDADITGIHSHPVFWRLLKEKVINTTELVLLEIVFTYSKNGKDSEGCYSSNRYFSNILGKSKSTIANTISRLRTIGLIISKELPNSKRYIKTIANMNDIDIDYIIKKYGKNSITKNSNTIVKSDESITKNSNGPLLNSVTPITKNSKHNYIYRINKGNDILGACVPQGAACSKKSSLEVKAKLTFPEKYGNKLHQLTKGTFTHPTKPSSWSKEIKKLLHEVTPSISKERIKNLIKWYTRHYEEEYTPKLYKVTDFSTKFPRIEDAMNRYTNKMKDPENRYNLSKSEPLPITEDGQWIYDHLKKGYTWPKGSINQLHQAIEMSLKNYLPFYNTLKYIDKEYKKYGNGCNYSIDEPRPTDEDRKKGFNRNLAVYFRKIHFQDIRNTVLNWFDWVNRKVTSWENWNGKLDRFVWEMENEYFLPLLQDWALSYTTGANRVNQLLEEIKKIQSGLTPEER